jgi:hypothetical protein
MVRALTSAVLSIGVLIALAFSQTPNDRGPGGPGRFGFGPPGLFGPGGPTSSAMLLGMPEIRTELGLTDAQISKVDGWIAESQAELRQAMNAAPPTEASPSDEVLQAYLDKLRRQTDDANAKADARLDAILTPAQSKRMAELRLQRDGASALLRPDLAQKLKLSAAQQEDLRHLEQGMRPNFDDGPPDFNQIEQARQRTQTEMLVILTDDQQATWDALVGKPFAFPPMPFFRGPGGPGGFGGPGGPPGMQERKLVAEFDKDGDDRLNASERQAARTAQPPGRPMGGGRGPGGGFGPPGGGPGGPMGRNREPAQPGMKVSPADVRSYPDAKLYEPTVLRTLFLDFDNADWETELEDFNNTDVEVPAKLTVDGVTYRDVGVHFRGMSSYGAVPRGYKRSLNLSLDYAHNDQRLYGYKTLNLLNCHEDPSCLSSVLYSHIARQHLPAPKANLVKVVINGENWGVYANVQQFNKEFLAENYDGTKGNRWKVRGSPGGGGGLDYVGDNIDDYRRRYEIKSGDSEKAWKSLIALCKTLSETPAEQLPAAIEPLLDVDSLLWFLAADVALINNDGYWVRASDYSIYQDGKGKFHIIPHDMNEAFHGAMGPGMGGPMGPGGPGRGPEGFGGRGGQRGGPPGGPGGFGGGPRGGGGGMELDPLVALDDPRKPLRSKILAVPKYRERYLRNVRTIAEELLDWKTLGPVVAQYRSLIEHEVEIDTRKLESFETFLRVTADEPTEERGRGREMPLRTFADQRRAYLLDHAEIRKLSR